MASNDIWALHAKSMIAEKEREYNTFSLMAIKRRVIESQEKKEKHGRHEIIARDFMNEDKHTMSMLQDAELNTLFYYFEQDKPTQYLRKREYTDFFFLISKYEHFFLDFKEEYEKLMEVKETVRPSGLD